MGELTKGVKGLASRQPVSVSYQGITKMLKWVEEAAHVRVVLPPLGPSAGVPDLKAPVHLLWFSVCHGSWAA